MKRNVMLAANLTMMEHAAKKNRTGQMPEELQVSH